MTVSQCCSNEPIALVTYDSWNEMKPVKVCRDHWNLKNETGQKHWQKWTVNVEFLEVIPVQ